MITNNNETAYREELRALTREMVMDFRKQQREHPPIHIDGTVVEKVERFCSSAYTSCLSRETN